MKNTVMQRISVYIVIVNSDEIEFRRLGVSV